MSTKPRAGRPRSPIPEADDSVEWDAELFLRFAPERARPPRDLIARVDGEPRLAYDLGCGPGASTRLVVEEYPAARVIGIDTSQRMLAEARRRHPDIAFERVDISKWRPSEPADLIFSDSALQWVPDHQALFPRLMGVLALGGTLAVEMPDNHLEPSQVLMRLLAVDGPWAPRLAPIAKTRAVISSHSDYYDWLRPLTSRLEMWRTTYIHPLAGLDALVDWFRGTALLPFLAPLSPEEREAFLARYRAELAEAYEIQADGRVLFLIPRLFIIARKAH